MTAAILNKNRAVGFGKGVVVTSPTVFAIRDGSEGMCACCVGPRSDGCAYCGARVLRDEGYVSVVGHFEHFANL